MNHRERVLHGDVASEHLVQLFGESESRAEAVATFLYQGWRAGAPLLVMARPTNWAMLAKRLEGLGCGVSDTIARGQLAVLDAATMLATFMVEGHPDAALFQEAVGAPVRRLSALGHLHIYGEMVDILAEQGYLEVAHELELAWNRLGAEQSFTLLCGYASAHFGDPRAAAALHRICRAHTRVDADPGDLLATWLVNDRQPQYHIDQ